MPTIAPELLAVAPEVADALRHQRPVVALESTLISHGLPYPQNVEVATASEDAIREASLDSRSESSLVRSESGAGRAPGVVASAVPPTPSADAC